MVLVLPLHTIPSFKLLSVSLHRLQEFFLEAIVVDTVMELVNDFVRDGRKVQEEYRKIRLDIFIWIHILDEGCSIFYHGVQVVESFNVVVVSEDVVPRGALDRSLRNLDPLKLMNNIIVFNLDTVAIPNVIILHDDFVGLLQFYSLEKVW